MLAEETPSSFVAFDLLAEGDDDLREQPFAERRGAARAAARRRRAAPVHLTPVDDRPDGRRATGSSASRAPGSTASSPSRSTSPTPRASARMLKVKHLRTADCVVAGYRRAQGRQGRRLAAARPLRRRRRRCTTSASRAASPRRCGAELADELEPLPGRRARRPPVAGVGRRRRRDEPASRMPGGREPLEREQGHVVGAAAHRAGRRGRLRAPARATASATPPASSAGAPTASRRRAPTSSSRPPVPVELREVFGV